MNDATQTGVAMAALTMVGTVVGVVVGYFKDRDKLRYDSELSGLRTQNAAQAKQMSDQDTEIAVLKKTHQECEKQHTETNARLVETNERLAVLERSLTDHLNRGTAQKPVLPQS